MNFARIFKDLDQYSKGLQGSSKIQVNHFAKIFEDPSKDLYKIFDLGSLQDHSETFKESLKYLYL